MEREIDLKIVLAGADWNCCSCLVASALERWYVLFQFRSVNTDNLRLGLEQRSKVPRVAEAYGSWKLPYGSVFRREGERTFSGPVP